MTCVVCSGRDWRAIPDPARGRSITTAGIILGQGLAKGQCMRCGLVARLGEEFVGRSDHYEERYADYYRRPGAPVYDASRYRAMADWLVRALPGWRPRRILDVGCGAGWFMTEMQRRYPESEIEGIEPSKANSELARSRGFPVHTYKVGEGVSGAGRYDLIYSINVLTHVFEPLAFMSGLREMLDDAGRLVILTVDSTVPSNELLWADHNYSFLPIHLVRLAERAGLVPVHVEANRDDVTIQDKQLVVLARHGARDTTIAEVDAGPTSVEGLYDARCGYVDHWRQTNEYLGRRARRHGRVVNFGASMWTWLLAGCCPDYWDGVDLCTVDQFGGRCLDKQVVPLADVVFHEDDGLVLGVHPRSQPAFRERFQGQPADIVSWDCYVQR